MTKRVVETREAEKVQAAKYGVFGRTKSWLFEGLKREDGAVGTDVREEEEGVARRTEHEERMRMMTAGMGTAPGEESEGMSGMGRESAVLRAVEEQNVGVRGKMEGAMKREGERERNGGMLDQLGTGGGSGGEAPKQGGGWMGFMSRR
jgi:hypothetical protein